MPVVHEERTVLGRRAEPPGEERFRGRIIRRERVPFDGGDALGVLARTPQLGPQSASFHRMDAHSPVAPSDREPGLCIFTDRVGPAEPGPAEPLESGDGPGADGVGDVLEYPALPGYVPAALPLLPFLGQRELRPAPQSTLPQRPELHRARRVVGDPLRRDSRPGVAVTLNGVPSLAAHVHDDDAPVLEAHREAPAAPFALLGGGAPRRARRLGLRETAPEQVAAAAAVQVQRSQRTVAARHRRTERILRVDPDAVREPTEAHGAPPALTRAHVPHGHAPIQRRRHRRAVLDADAEHGSRVRLVGWTEFIHRDRGVVQTGVAHELIHVQGPSKQIPAVARGDQVHGSRCRGPFLRFFIPGV